MSDQTDSEWRPVEGFPEYEATIDGRCRRNRGLGLIRELRAHPFRVTSRGKTYTYFRYHVASDNRYDTCLTTRQVALRAFGEYRKDSS